MDGNRFLVVLSMIAMFDGFLRLFLRLRQQLTRIEGIPLIQLNFLRFTGGEGRIRDREAGGLVTLVG